MKRLIIFLIRKRLGLKKYEEFQFVNQKNKKVRYYFGDDAVWKADPGYAKLVESSVSLNWLLNDECAIVKCGVFK